MFIDGRMPSWRQTESERESSYALGDYLKVLTGQSELEKIFKKYNINLVLWSNMKKNPPLLKNILNSWQNIFIIKYSDEEFIKMLEKSGWKKIYSDEMAVIYKRYSLFPPPPKIGDSI